MTLKKPRSRRAEDKEEVRQSVVARAEQAISHVKKAVPGIQDYSRFSPTSSQQAQKADDRSKPA
ncbi:hypothetical protein AAE478_010039 [Parahypoxylon ruwenzoriense]